MITSSIRTDDHKLLQKSNLTVRRPCKVLITFKI